MSKLSIAAVVDPNIGLDQPFNVELDIPGGYQQLQNITPGLIYPMELAAIGNWDVPPSQDEAWPRVDLTPESGALFWLVQGDVRYDYEVMPSQGDWFIPTAYSYLGPNTSARGPAPGEPAVVGTERAFTGADLVGSPWENADAWARLMPIASPDGDTPARPPYLVLYVFAGRKGPSLEELNEVVQSVTIEYT